MSFTVQTSPLPYFATSHRMTSSLRWKVGGTVSVDLKIAVAAGLNAGAPIDPDTVDIDSILRLPSTTVTVPPIAIWAGLPAHRSSFPSGWTGIVATHLAVGEWMYDIPTVGWVAGSYTVTFKLLSGPAAAAYPTVTFVLKP